MFAGIMAIFEMGLSLTGRSLLPEPEDPYFSNEKVKLADRHLLALLADTNAIPSGLSGELLCTSLRKQYQAKYLSPGEPNTWLLDPAMPVLSGRWVGACLLTNGDHRVVINSTSGSQALSYQFYSCVLPPGVDRCSFEQE